MELVIPEFQQIADAIRHKAGTSEKIRPADFAAKISEISGTANYVALLIITAPAGAQVTAVSDEEVLTGVADENDQCIIQVHQPGTFRVFATYGTSLLGPVIVEDVSTYSHTAHLVPTIVPPPEWSQLSYEGAITPWSTTSRRVTGVRLGTKAIFFGGTTNPKITIYDSDLVKTEIVNDFQTDTPMGWYRGNEYYWIESLTSGWVYKINSEGIISAVKQFNVDGCTTGYPQSMFDDGETVLFCNWMSSSLTNQRAAAIYLDADLNWHRVADTIYYSTSYWYPITYKIKNRWYNRNYTRGAYWDEDWVGTVLSTDITAITTTYAQNFPMQLTSLPDKVVVMTTADFRILGEDFSVSTLTTFDPSYYAYNIRALHYAGAFFYMSDYSSSYEYWYTGYLEESGVWHALGKITSARHGWLGIAPMGRYLILAPGSQNATGTSVELLKLT